MQKSLLAVLFAAGAACLVFTTSLPLFAQQGPPPPRNRISPHETVSMVIDGGRITLVYGRPYSKDPKSGEVRQIWGVVVPYGKVWRFGADEATLFITQQTIELGGTTIPAGAYTLFMLLEQDSAKLIVNKQVGHWGLQYDEKQDLARIELKKAPLENNVDQFTLSLAKNPSGGGTLNIWWEKTHFSVAISAKK